MSNNDIVRCVCNHEMAVNRQRKSSNAVYCPICFGMIYWKDDKPIGVYMVKGKKEIIELTIIGKTEES